MSDKRCKCPMSISVLGDGCRYCQPQEYIDRLHDQIEDMEQEAAQQSEPSTNAVPDAWRELMQEFVDAMVDYQMDVEESPPFKHRDMMDRARDLLASKPAMSPLPGVYPDRQPIDSEGGHHD